MHEPSVRGSRLAIAAGLVSILTVAGAGFLLGRKTAPAPQVVMPVPVAPSATPIPEPSPPHSGKALGRSEMLKLANLAADAAASGEALPQDVKDAQGRRFNLALPFGCSGPAGDGSPSALSWRIDTDKDTLRISAKPDTWASADWGREGSDSITGFWVARPWSSSERCPAKSGQPAAAGSEAVTLPGQTFAIAQFDAKDPQWRPFEKIQRMNPETTKTAGGFVLRLSGRIAAPAGGKLVQCVQPAGQEQRPICVLAAKFEEVRLENGATGDVLGVWDERALQR